MVPWRPGTPVCQGGAANIVLIPPPPAPCDPSEKVSFQTSSGMYFRADSKVSSLLLALQKDESFAMNIVPPTAVTKGRDAGIPVAIVSVEELAQTAPLSPEDAKNVIPCAAACSAIAAWSLAKACPASCSQSEKLSVITSARLLSMM